MHAKQTMLAAVCAAAVLAAPAAAYAQSVPPAPAGASKPAANGVKSYEVGAKSFEAGKFTSAIQSLSNALSAGGLSSQQMAKALYYRGVAYRKTGKSAQAISDLTSAVWLKNGLSDADRAAAMENRQGAYQEAGLGNAVPIGTPPLDAPASVAVAPPAPVVPAADSATSSWTATSAKNAADASVPNLSSPSGGYASLSTPDAPTLSALPRSDATPQTDTAPLAGVGNAFSNAGSAVTGFFGNMFGGGTATSTPSIDVATAANPAVAAPPPPSVQAPAAAADWNSATSIVAGQAKKPEAKKPETTKKLAAVEKPRAAASGKFRLQVGIVPSREEAETISARLRSEHAANLGAATPAIDEVTFGNGTFYRVQVGPYASAAEPGEFCTTLKPKGYDCLVVTK
jgi:tetratricopeptide (TPR) repeat protein